MILLYNVYITETNPKLNNIQLNYKKNRGNLNNQFNFDIFKYSIASVSKIYNWKKAIIYVKLDEIYNHRKDELEQFLKKEFEFKLISSINFFVKLIKEYLILELYSSE